MKTLGIGRKIVVAVAALAVACGGAVVAYQSDVAGGTHQGASNLSASFNRVQYEGGGSNTQKCQLETRWGQCLDNIPANPWH
ncbi:MAG: hypothetical protein LBV06_09650 [Propionibacteriaceae bacterium]|jgi:hypothetical protein|nr:hypothetical protein [Propionibacteriaceae bacterium]